MYIKIGKKYLFGLFSPKNTLNLGQGILLSLSIKTLLFRVYV
jgi:hypothetical protein